MWEWNALSVLPKDIVTLLAHYVWTTRLDLIWEQV